MPLKGNFGHGKPNIDPSFSIFNIYTYDSKSISKLTFRFLTITIRSIGVIDINFTTSSFEDSLIINFVPPQLKSHTLIPQIIIYTAILGFP